MGTETADNEGSRGVTLATWPTAIIGIPQKKIATYRPGKLGSHTLKDTSTLAALF
jgi:hypothetical protein